MVAPLGFLLGLITTWDSNNLIMESE
jgi:hypothetical protein